MKITITIITIILSCIVGYYFYQRYDSMKHDCDNISGKFYTISFDEGTCVIGEDVIHFHYNNRG